jgi:hypothetical protein
MAITLTVDDNTPRVQYTASASQTAFTYPFIIFDTADLKVYQNDTLLTYTTDYTADTINDNAGGTVTLVTGATAGDIITIERDISVARSSNFQQSSDFDPEDFNVEQRKEIAIMQQLERDIARKIGFSTTSTASATSLPDPDSGKFLGWSGTDLANLANPVSNTLTTIAGSDAYKIVTVDTTGDNVSYLAHGAQGGVLCSGGSSGVHTYTTAGTSGQVLTSNGAGSAPTFQSNSLGGDWTSFDPAYDKDIGAYPSAVGYYATGYYLGGANLSDEVSVVVLRDSSTSQRYRIVALREDSNGFSKAGNLLGPNVATQGVDICKVDTDKFLIAYTDGTANNLEIEVGSVPAGLPTPTTGTAVSAYTTEEPWDVAVDQLGTDAAVMAFVEEGDPNKVFMQAVTISGTTPTAGTAVEMSADSTYNLDVVALSSTRALVAFSDADTTNSPTVALGSISGTTVTDLGELAIETTSSLATAAAIACGKVDSSTAVVVYFDDGTDESIKWGIVDITGDTLSITATGTLLDVDTSTSGVNFYLTPLGSGVFCLTFGVGSDIPHRCIFTATTSTVTFNKVEPVGDPMLGSRASVPVYNSSQDEVTIFTVGGTSTSTGVHMKKMRKSLS